jgi:hypothetical protein
MEFMGVLFSRRGFEWIPLQTPGIASRLQIPEESIRDEMKLQLPDGRVAGGVDVWGHLLRSVWWLWPLGVVISLPGFHFVSQVFYRVAARNRYRFGGKCASRPKRQRRTIPFLDLP